MIVNCVYVHVKKDVIEDFVKATRENHLESVREEGNLRFDLIQKDGDPTRFMIYEAFDSPEAADFHKTTAHYLRWRDGVKEMMADQRVGVRYTVIEPADRKQW